MKTITCLHFGKNTAEMSAHQNTAANEDKKAPGVSKRNAGNMTDFGTRSNNTGFVWMLYGDTH